MIGILLAVALTFDCTYQLDDVENDGKIYQYGYPPRVKRELVVAGKTYSCTQDYPQAVGTGIRTIGRNQCGPLTLFFQTFYKSCDYDDINPSPAGFEDYENGKKLLAIQHECIKKGSKFIAGWHKLRDKNNVEWELENYGIGLGRSRRSVCSGQQKIDIEQETFKIEKTGDILEFYNFTTYPLKSVKDKPVPSF